MATTAVTPIHPAWTWQGILEHLTGLKNYSGRNGLATFTNVSVQSPQLSAGVLGQVLTGTGAVSGRRRHYGTQDKGVSVGISAQIPISPLLSVGGGVKLDWKEYNFVLGGKYSLVDVFKKVRNAVSIFATVPRITGILTVIIQRIPDIQITGDLTVYYGWATVSYPDDTAYIRLQSGAGLKYQLPTGALRHSPIRGGGASMGRSWQIQLEKWQAHWPRALTYP